MVFPEIVREVSAGVLYVELRLVQRIEPMDQLVQPSLPHDEDDLIFGQAFHSTTPDSDSCPTTPEADPERC